MSIIYNIPELEFKVYVNGRSVYTEGIPEDSWKISFASGYNSVKVVFRCLNCSLTRAMLTVQKGAKEDVCPYDCGPTSSKSEEVATIVGSIAANTTQTLEFEASNRTFTEGDGVYTLSIYAKSAVDGSWNEYDILLSAVGTELQTSNGLSLYTINAE